MLASNIGGAATLIGDPPNIIIASRSGLTFNDFLVHMAPIVVIALVVFTLVLPLAVPRLVRRRPGQGRPNVMGLNEREAIQDTRLLIKCGVVLLLVFTGFVGHSVFHVEPSVVALLGAGLLVLISGVHDHGLHGQRRVGDAAVLRRPVHHGRRPGQDRRDRRPRRAASAKPPAADALLAVMLILVVSALLSGIIDNIPYVATMSPVVLELAKSIADPAHAEALWWALAARRRLRRQR